MVYPTGSTFFSLSASSNNNNETPPFPTYICETHPLSPNVPPLPSVDLTLLADTLTLTRLPHTPPSESETNDSPHRRSKQIKQVAERILEPSPYTPTKTRKASSTKKNSKLHKPCISDFSHKEREALSQLLQEIMQQNNVSTREQIGQKRLWGRITNIIQQNQTYSSLQGLDRRALAKLLPSPGAREELSKTATAIIQSHLQKEPNLSLEYFKTCILPELQIMGQKNHLSETSIRRNMENLFKQIQSQYNSKDILSDEGQTSSSPSSSSSPSERE